MIRSTHTSFVRAHVNSGRLHYNEKINTPQYLVHPFHVTRAANFYQETCASLLAYRLTQCTTLNKFGQTKLLFS
jgi:hypothetical protein